MTRLHAKASDRLSSAWSPVQERVPAMYGKPPGAPGATGAPGSASDASNAHAARAANGAERHARNIEHERGSWWRAGLRFVRNASIGLALIVAVPLIVVAVKGPNITMADSNSLSDRLSDIERMRPYEVRGYAIGVDETITPLEAGRALHRLQSAKSSDAFPMHDPGERHARPWKTQAMMPDMFRRVGQDFRQREPQRIIAATKEAFSPEEMAWLRNVAEAPIWNDFDLVARAPAVDMIAGQYTLPFRDDASVVSMPIARFQDTKELASAALARAAYYKALGEYDRAEAVLRSVVSFGFAYIDNASHSMDALIGRVLVKIGRDGLTEFYATTDRSIPDARALERTTFPPIGANGSAGKRPDWKVTRQHLLTAAADPELSRGLRLESLRSLSFGVCTNVGEMLTGHSVEVSEAYQAARASIARYSSEQAYLDLMLQSPDRVPPWTRGSLSERLISGASEVAATVLRNPRISGCARLALSHSG